MYTPFLSHLINNMDHMRNFGYWTLVSALSQTVVEKVEKVMPQKSRNKLKPKGMVNKPTQLQFQLTIYLKCCWLVAVLPQIQRYLAIYV